MWTLAVIAALWGLCAADLTGRDLVVYDCSNANGVVWWGCGSYGLCQGGQYAQIDCSNGTVYNRQAQQCTPAGGNVPYPCGSAPPDCSPYIESPGHRRPVTQPDTYENRPACSYYYTCSYGRFLGYQACPNEQVYDEGEQRCDLTIAVPPPCGVGPQQDEGLRSPGQGQTRSPFQNPSGLGGLTRNPPGQGSGPTRNPNPNPGQQQQPGLGATRGPSSGQVTNAPFSGNNPGRNPGQGGQGWGSQGPVYGGQAPGFNPYGGQGQGQGQGQGGSPGAPGPVRGGQTYGTYGPGQGQGQGQGQEIPRAPEESWYWY